MSVKELAMAVLNFAPTQLAPICVAVELAFSYMEMDGSAMVSDKLRYVYDTK